MTYRVLATVKLKTPQGGVELRPGQLVNLGADLAFKLSERGKVEAVNHAVQPVYSEILGGYLWITDDEYAEDLRGSEDAAGALYSMSEIQELKGKPSEHLRAVDEAKRTFPGSTIIKRRGGKKK